jgi:putative transposase
MIRWLGISHSKYYSWEKRLGQPNQHNGHIVRDHWILPWERQAILAYYRDHPSEGYRRLTYMMIDEDIVYVSPSTTYRVLKDAGLLCRWNTSASKSAKRGFDQPRVAHEHWHIDIKYVNFKGSFLFYIGIIDGYTRYIVHHELRHSMCEYDVEITLQRALEKFPGVQPRIISDNGSQFISKDFSEYLRHVGLQQARTSVAYPQSNGKIERYFGSLTRECLRRTSFIDLNDAKGQIDKYVEHYNNVRLHSSLGYLTPNDYLIGNVKERYNERDRKLDQARKNRINARSAA